MDAYKTIQETAALWNCTERNVQLLCKRGNIPGAKKISGVWLLPAEAVRQKSRIEKSSSPIRADKLYGRNTPVRIAPHPAETAAEETGCTITPYQILDGITLVFQDIHEEHLDYGSEIPQLPGDLIAIQHCREGRFEGEYPNGACIYMGPGSLSVNLPAWAPATNSFPLRHYHGFYIAILPEPAEASIAKLEQLLGPMGIMLSGLVEHLSEKNKLAFYDTDATIAGRIASIYESYKEGREERLRLQVLELLQLLGTQETLQPEPGQYFPREQAAVIKEIRQYLVSHLDRHIPLPELADRFRISLTGMKNCFKSVYGQPVGMYLREYRMQVGAEKLRNSGLKIIEIAASLGYENPSKFTEAFSARYGMTPSTYRKIFVRKEGCQTEKSGNTA